jgi:nucleoside-diphosphate-sugar epimerase
MNILLTGSTGYLGSRVAARLDALGLPWCPLACRLGQLEPVSLAVDSVIHCAGALRNRPDQLHPVNAEGTRQLVAALSRPTRIVYVSTRSVYPHNGHRLVDESVAAQPFDDYGRSKLEGEAAIVGSGHPYAIFRSSGIFGHPSRTGIFLDRALDLALAGQPVTLASPDRDEDYIDVDWLAAILVRAAVEGILDGHVLNAGGPPRPLGETLSAMAATVLAAGRPAPTIQYKELPLPSTVVLDSSRLTALVSSPRHPPDREIFARMIPSRLQGSMSG